MQNLHSYNPMRRRSLIYVCIVLAAYLDAGAQALSPREVLDKYCVTCHNQSLKTAGLMLDRAELDHAGALALPARLAARPAL